MPRISLRGAKGTAKRRSLRLDDDFPLKPVDDQMPVARVVYRSQVGYSDAGDPILDWVSGPEVSIAVYGRTEVVVDGVQKDAIRLQAVDDGSVLGPEVMLQLEWGSADDRQVFDYWRIKRAERNGVRVKVEAERVR